MPHQFRLVAEIYRFRSLEHFVMFGTILPVTAVGSVFASMIVLDVVVECLGGLEAQVAWLVFMEKPAAAVVAVQGGRGS
jgi:uncharacterized metal-binding protein